MFILQTYKHMHVLSTQAYFDCRLPNQEPEKLRDCLVYAFKQQFSVFLEIRVGEKMCEKMCNVV